MHDILYRNKNIETTVYAKLEYVEKLCINHSSIQLMITSHHAANSPQNALLIYMVL